MKALIVDDVEMNRELLAMFLEGRAAVACAESGEDALKLVEEALGADAYFDLICMDIFMPGMDGHETLKKIREMEAAAGCARATVFMVTGSSSPDDMFDALIQGGCDDYLTKPLMQQSFSDLLTKHGLC
jgi:two-component system chemotaxis response regulator CheY